MGVGVDVGVGVGVTVGVAVAIGVGDGVMVGVGVSVGVGSGAGVAVGAGEAVGRGKGVGVVVSPPPQAATVKDAAAIARTTARAGKKRPSTTLSLLDNASFNVLSGALGPTGKEGSFAYRRSERFPLCARERRYLSTG